MVEEAPLGEIEQKKETEIAPNATDIGQPEEIE